MLLTQSETAPSRAGPILAAAAVAARAIPPAFPLAATVAVNPFLGQAGEDLATASARLARVAGVRLTRRRAAYAADVASGAITEDDLAAALAACQSPRKPPDVASLTARLGAETPSPKPLPTVADLVAARTGVDWPAVIMRCLGLWAGGYFDCGQALWSPTPGRTAFAAWREWAIHDLTPEIAGLAGFCAHVAAVPDTPERAILRAADRLGIGEAAAETAFHRLLIDLGGWSQHARGLVWNAELAGGEDATLIDLLAVRLVWEEALIERTEDVAADWQAIVARHAQPVIPTSDEVVDAIFQDAAERAHRRGLARLLTSPPARASRPVLQAAFCIDVRSEVYRRALEGLDPTIETIGFAGFFGLPLAHRGPGSDVVENHLPVLLRPDLSSSSHGDSGHEQAARIRARAARAWGRFRQAAVSSFAFVEAAGPAYGVKLLREALGLGHGGPAGEPLPRLESPLSPEARAAMGAAILKAMSLSSCDARLVLLVGHGARMANNPHESAYHCGACGGYTGAVSARVLAQLLNDPETRARLPAHGIAASPETLFVAGLHDTTTDAVTLFADDPPAGHRDDIVRAEAWLAQAGALARAERASRLPSATARTVLARATNWAEVRPEWGLAGCAAFIAAPRAVTARADLQGRAFLHSYDWRGDEGFATLELILTAPVVVASWISLQYYGSAVAPQVFGGGNKLIHNVVGGLGVVEGNGGSLRTGLPWQAIHDGARLVHEPLRLAVLVEAPKEAVADVLARHADVRALFDNGWMHLVTLEEGHVAWHYRPGLAWERAA